MCPKEAKISANMPENFVENFEIWKPKGDTLIGLNYRVATKESKFVEVARSFNELFRRCTSTSNSVLLNSESKVF